MTKKLLLFAYSLLLASLFVACGNKETKKEERAYTVKGNTVYVNENSNLNNKIVVGEVTEGEFSREVVTAGTVQAIPTQFAYIAPPVSGRVTRSFIKLGQQVAVNTPLFEIISADFSEIQKDFFSAKSERELLRKDLRRKEDLLKNGVGSQKELEEAISAMEIAEKEYENAYSAIKMFGANPETLTFGDPLIVYSPIAGQVLENNIVTGQFIADDAEPVATVANLSKVWIVAQVKEKDIRFINEGDEMDIQVSALPGHTIKGEVFHVDNSFDEDTRSIRVLSVCNNEERLLKIGMFATVSFIDKPERALVIPERSLLQDEKTSFVYVKGGSNEFIKTPVIVETIREGKAIISGGITKGTQIITEGGYYLK